MQTETLPTLSTTPRTGESLPDTVLGRFSEAGISANCGPDGFGFEGYSLSLTTESGEWTIPHWTMAPSHQRGTARNDMALQIALDWVKLGKNGQYRIDLSILNEGSFPRLLKGIKFGQFGDQARFRQGPGHVLGWGMRYAHTGNLRTERYPFCAADYPYLRQLPPEKRILGDTEDQPFPALFLGNAISKEYLVFAFTRQERAVPVFEFQRRNHFSEAVFETFEIRWHFPQSGGYTLKPGETFTPESLYIQIGKDREVDSAFEDYLDYIAEITPGKDTENPVFTNALHCTWNYGVFDDQKEETLIDTARFIAKNLPEIRFFLIDDGYLEHEEKSTRVHLNRFYPDPENARVCPDSWPTGIRGFTDKLRNLGLRPGLWWTPMIQLPCRLHDDHPEWFLRKANGKLFLIGEKLAYLDYSHPEALAFLDRTLAHIQGEWGIDAVKIDFWSQNFETNQARLQNSDCSGIDLRRKFFETVRKHLPKDGVVMSCIAMGMGNPFLSEFVDTYRCSMDIHEGYWEDQVNNCNWMLPILGFGGRRTGILLNTDSIGFNPKIPENETNFRLTWAYITMGLIETGGRLEDLSPEDLSALRKLLRRCDRGYPTRCPDLRAYSGDPHPESLYVTFPPGSPTAQSGIRQSIAFFNWHDHPRAISIDLRAIGQNEPVIAKDFWNGATETWNPNFITVKLDPHCARLFDIYKQ
ncbi:alpha-galactosidase [Puniceicoccus vermicola]|uniref:Alpha-galactosidase n=1 Tax=Puniceicoccus vermicola TaxID=388746 RepID=A0A7X1E509_9BACT|nr:alpha-galactosidase [Puniceicoccus vermicola]MBC2602676.1 alpha-galactosidase [Puniceicoccus vermicola]